MDYPSNNTSQQQQQQQQHHGPIEHSNNNIYYSPISAINHDVRRRNVAAAASFHSVVGGGNGGGGTNVYYNADPWDEMDSSLNNHNNNNNNYYSTNATVTSDATATTWHPHEFGNQQHSSLHQQPPTNSEFCTCRFLTRQRRMSSSATGWKPLSKTSSSFSDQKSTPLLSSLHSKVCSRCGKMISSMNMSNNNGFAWSRHHSRSNSFSYLNPESVAYASHSDGNPMHQLPEVPHHTAALLLVTPQLRFISAASTDMQGTASSQKHVTHQNLLAQIIQAAVDRTNSIASGKSGSHNATSVGSSDTTNSTDGVLDEYQRTLIRDRSNQLAAAELASLLWVLAHEMSLEEYGVVESQVFTAVFALVHAADPVRRMAGLAAIDALLAAPSADEERKAIKFANTLSNGLRSAHGDFEFLSAVCKALGHMVTRTANVDFVESEVTRALEWLRTDRSDRRYVSVEWK